MAAVSPKIRGLSDSDRQALESRLVAFDQFWSDRLLAERVRGLPAESPLRLPALAEMVKIDLERQWQCGRRISLESYLEQYPELGTPQNVSADLIQAEYEVRHQFGEATDLADYARRFPRQASRLRQLVEQADGSVANVPNGLKPALRTDVGQADGSAVDAPADQAKHDTARSHVSTPSVGRRAGGPAPLPEQFGRYRILRQLGRGGMGTVYLAHDTQLDRDVALKVPAFAPDDGPEILERFVREAQAAATINHPNICPIYDVGEIDGIHFLTMAHIEGRPLSEFVGGEKPLPQRQVATAIKKIALALEEAHQRGVIHRDLKPSNIMINKRREPVIMDFGLARRVKTQNARITQSGAMLGTPAYMPPEQVSGDVAAMGPRSDIYSLGVILYELLTDRLPFDGSPTSVLAKILTQEPPAPSLVRSEVAPALEAICQKAMSKKVEHRYATMAEFSAALSDYLRSEACNSSQPEALGASAAACNSPGISVLKAAESPAEQPFTQTTVTHKSGVTPPFTPPPPTRWYHGFSRWSWLAAAAVIATALGGIIGVLKISNEPSAELSNHNADEPPPITLVGNRAEQGKESADETSMPRPADAEITHVEAAGRTPGATISDELLESLAVEIRRIVVPSPNSGTIASTTPTAVNVTLGSKDGVKRGQMLVVFRNAGVLADPETGKSLGQQRARIAHLEIVEVTEESSKARVLGNFENRLRVGDSVEAAQTERPIAILPIPDEDGRETPFGRELAETLTECLSRQGVKLVERSLLSKVLGEQVLQQTRWFNPETAQQAGRQIGAFAVVSGSIVGSADTNQAHVRLINVETGEIMGAWAIPETSKP